MKFSTALIAAIVACITDSAIAVRLNAKTDAAADRWGVAQTGADRATDWAQTEKANPPRFAQTDADRRHHRGTAGPPDLAWAQTDAERSDGWNWDLMP